MPWIPQGDANLAYWCNLLAGTPVVAIGGMDARRAQAAMQAGAWAVAVVGAITRSDDPRAAIAELQQATGSTARVPSARVPAFARTTLIDAGP
jgi:thiamine monophosphate synthase